MNVVDAGNRPLDLRPNEPVSRKPGERVDFEVVVVYPDRDPDSTGSRPTQPEDA